MNLTRRSRFTFLAAPVVLTVGILLGQRAWKLERAPKYADIDLKARGSFAFDGYTGRTEEIPQCWRDLDGHRVSLIGFMFSPTVAGPGAHSCQLVYDSHPSHFKPPLVQDRVYATAPITTGVYSQYDPVRADGVFRVGVQRDGSGAVHSIFRMDVESVTALSGIPNRAPPMVHSTAWDGLLLGYLLVGAFLMFTRLRYFRVGTCAATGLCPIWGYDLRATPTRCPECGAVPTAKGAQ